MISCESVSFVYNARGDDPVRALDDVNAEVAEHEFVSLLGPSGCGKSTLLKILAGLLNPTSGRVSVRGESPTEFDGLGMMFQSPVLLPWRTVWDNVLLPGDVAGKRKQFEGRARELLDMAGIGEFAKKYPYQLSGGMQQRVSLCRSLINDPQVLLMDEPFGALDAMTRDQLNIELLNIWQQTKKTVVFVTHSIQEATFLSDRVVMMSPRPGRISQVFDIPLPRPRTVETMGTSEFTAISTEIRRSLMGTVSHV